MTKENESPKVGQEVPTSNKKKVAEAPAPETQAKRKRGTETVVKMLRSRVEEINALIAELKGDGVQMEVKLENDVLHVGEIKLVKVL